MFNRRETLSRDTTLAMLIDQGLPLLKNPTAAAFAHWRDALGTLRLIDWKGSDHPARSRHVG